VTQKATPVLLMELGPAPNYEALKAQLDRCIEDMARIHARDLDNFVHESRTKPQPLKPPGARLLATTASRSAAIREQRIPKSVKKAPVPPSPKEVPETECPRRRSTQQATPSPTTTVTPFSARRTPRRALNPFPQLSPFLTESQRKKAASPLPKPNSSKYRRKKITSSKKRKTPRTRDAKPEIEHAIPEIELQNVDHTLPSSRYQSAQNVKDCGFHLQRTVSKSNAFAEIINKSCFNT